MKQIILTWTYSEKELPLDAFIKEATADSYYIVHSITPVTYSTGTAHAVWGPSHYHNIFKAIVILNQTPGS